MDLLTSYQGIPHLTSAQFRSIIESITGVGSCIADIDEKMEIELAENNTVKIRSGVLIHHGGVMQIKKGTYDTATYQNGTQAMKRIDLLVARYTKSADTKIEKAEWVIIQGTPDEESPIAPAYTEGNMQDGDLVDDCPFAELHFDGINVVEVVMLVDVTENISTLKEIIKKMLEEIDKLNSKINKVHSGKVTLTFTSGIATWDISSFGLTGKPKSVQLTGASYYAAYSVFDNEMSATQIKVRDSVGNTGNYSVWYTITETD